MNSSTQHIEILGVSQNNLKSIDLNIPLKKITVITGVSGSGKSSLAFDTLFAEGSRRYMESLSTYARQFLEQVPRPIVETIHNLPPAIALEQRNSITNSRTTIASMMELYDYLRLLFAIASEQNCYACGHHEVAHHNLENILSRVLSLPEETRFFVLSPLDKETLEIMPIYPKESSLPLGQSLYKHGIQRLLCKGEIIDLSSSKGQLFELGKKECFILVDRLIMDKRLKKEPSRLVESIESALRYSGGRLEIYDPKGKGLLKLREGYSCARCAEVHQPPHPPLFSYNTPLGACSDCKGFGEILEINEELVVPNKKKSLRQHAIDPFAKPSNQKVYKDMLEQAQKYKIRLDTPYEKLNKEEKKIIWEGEEDFIGILPFFKKLERKRYKMHIRIFIRRYQGLKKCIACNGTRLSQEALRYTVGKDRKSIADILSFTINELLSWTRNLELPSDIQSQTKEILKQMEDRLVFLEHVGVAYLRLNRKGNTLSGGEYQRISLAAQLGSRLSQTLYVLDEPSIGLHPVDTDKLIQAIQQLKEHGNTVVIVEHDMEIMRAADYLVELGPKAGRLGGELIAKDYQKKFIENRKSLTAKYLNGEFSLKLPPKRKRPNPKLNIALEGCSHNNLKNIDVKIPLGLFVAVTGVSGSGKSSLVHDTLYKVLAKTILNHPIAKEELGRIKRIRSIRNVHSLALLDQKPIGRSSSSNPATYLKIYDKIRWLLSQQPQAARQGFTPGHFSFNVEGGRCPDCKGDGTIEVDMHFMANIQVVCEECLGKRFKKNVLEVRYKEKNIDDILHTTIEDAFLLFSDTPFIVEQLQILKSIGLEYLQLGQSLTTLSGGECQRLKIALTLAKQKGERKSSLLIFDEPTTGLHLQDIKKLAKLFHKLVEEEHSLIVIEHNPELICQADWIIDMGPEGGEKGGKIVAEGSPEEVAKNPHSITGRYLKNILAGQTR